MVEGREVSIYGQFLIDQEGERTTQRSSRAEELALQWGRFHIICRHFMSLENRRDVRLCVSVRFVPFLSEARYTIFPLLIFPRGLKGRGGAVGWNGRRGRDV